MHSAHHSSDGRAAAAPYQNTHGMKDAPAQTDVPSQAHLNFSYHRYCFAFSGHCLLQDEPMFHSPRVEARTEDGLLHAVQSLQLSHRSRNTNREPKGCPCSTHRSHRAPFPRDEPGQPRTVPGRGGKISGCGLRELWVFFLLLLSFGL